MMATTAVIAGLSSSTTTTGKRLLSSSSSSSCYSDVTEKLSFLAYRCYYRHQFSRPKHRNLVVSAAARKPSNNYTRGNTSTSSTSNTNRHQQSIRALPLEDHPRVDRDAAESVWLIHDRDVLDHDSCSSSVDALLLLQKSMLEKQWNLSFDTRPPQATLSTATGAKKKIPVTCSGVSARHRRITARNKALTNNNVHARATRRPVISPDLLHNRFKGYVNGVVADDLLTHAQVVRLSNKIKIGLSLEQHKSRLKERLGCEPSDEQLATSLRISRAELHSKLIESSLAREKLAMSNVRLVMSIAQRYDNMGAEMADLIQGGLVGLLRGIEKFDSSKGFRISTYVYWWIRQGVSRALVENSRTLRLPTHLHERLSSIRSAKIRLEERGITPSLDRIAECLNMSKKKVRNATEAISKVFSLDREAFPSLNGLPGETHHSYVADNCPENIPWHGVDEWALKDDVNKLVNTTLGERERDIIRLYYGLDNECLTWEDISKRIGLSRERVRQVGLVALEKLKHAARRKRMEAMLVKH